MKCAALLDGYYDLSTLHDVSIPLDHSAGTQTVIASSPKISGGKVTGYNLVGTTTATPDTVNLGFIFTANAGPRPAGDHRRKTAALPNTPVVLPV